MKNKHLIFFLLLYAVVFIILLPSFIYITEADSTGYFSVAEKIAQGRIFESINGIWSPLGSWLLAPLIKAGYNGVIAEKWLNGLYGFICLTAFFSLMKKMKIIFFGEVAIMVVALILMLHFAFNVLFGDLLVLVFLLLYLNVISNKEFGVKYGPVVLAAVLGGLAFYAKMYAFYFVLLQLPVVLLYIEKKKNGRYFSAGSLKKVFAAVGVLLITVSFWVAALNVKYGHIIPGQKNITGTLAGISAPSKQLFCSPAPGNYALFDDISYVYSTDITPFTSFKFFVVQVKLAVANAISLPAAFNEFSIAFCMIVLVSLFLLFKKGSFMNRDNNSFILLSLLITWSAGFLLFSIQSRFLWITDLGALLLAGILLSEFCDTGFFSKKQALVFSLLVIGSFAIYPLMQLKVQRWAGKAIYDTAEALKRIHIQGNIIAGIRTDTDYTSSIILNYLTGSKFYGLYDRNYTTGEVLKGISDYRIDYYFFYYNSDFEKQVFLTGEICRNADKIYENITPGLLVLHFNNPAVTR